MECMSTIRLRVSVRLAHRAQVLALSSLSAKSAFFFVSFTRRIVRHQMPPQPVDATQALNLSAGVSNPKVLRGRSLS